MTTHTINPINTLSNLDASFESSNSSNNDAVKGTISGALIGIRFGPIGVLTDAILGGAIGYLSDK